MVAVADYGQWGAAKEVVIENGKSTSKTLKKTPDGRPLWIPWQLERAFICQRTEWKVLPDDLDEQGTRSVKQAMEVLAIYDAFKQFGDDLTGVTAGQERIISLIEDLRDDMKD